MPLSHYPKTVTNLVFAWVQPPPPDVALREGLPNFLGRPFSELNLFREPIAPGTSVVGYHDAQPFTRFYGTLFADSALNVRLSFSNDEVDSDGHVVCDDNISRLNYDGLGLFQAYDPAKQDQTGKFFCLILGRWMRFQIENVGREPTKMLRAFVRGSVF